MYARGRGWRAHALSSFLSPPSPTNATPPTSPPGTQSLFLESISPVLDSHEWLTVVDDLPELSTPPDSGGKGFGQGGGKGGGKGGDSWGGGNRRDSWGKGGGGWGGRGGGRGGGGWGGGSPGGGRGGGFGGGRGGRDGYGGGRGRW